MRVTLTYSVLFGLFSFLKGSRFRCDYTHIPQAHGYFKYQEIPANWAEARLRCHLEGGQLASPVNIELRSAMKILMEINTQNKDGIFTGINAYFSRGDFRSIEGTPLSKIPHIWAPGEPNNLYDQEQCIMMRRDGTIADVNCADPLPYICYRNSSRNVLMTECGTVDRDYVLDKRTGSCYKFHKVPRRWTRAYMTCIAEGGYLAIINSQTESKVIQEIFAKNPAALIPGAFWKDVAFIGFHDWGEHGEFLTINGQTLSEAGFDNFSPGEPTNATTGEYCGSVYRNGLFNDIWCENSYAFICEKDPRTLLCDDS